MVAGDMAISHLENPTQAGCCLRWMNPIFPRPSSHVELGALTNSVFKLERQACHLSVSIDRNGIRNLSAVEVHGLDGPEWTLDAIREDSRLVVARNDASYDKVTSVLDYTAGRLT